MIIIRINELAQHLGVHRNTIRNWVKSGKLPARSIPGKRYLVTESDFRRVCAEYGLDPESIDVKYLSGKSPSTDKQRVVTDGTSHLRVGSGSEQHLRPSPQWANVCLTCGSCASACPVSGIRGLDPRKVVRMAAFGLEQDLIDSQWPWICTMCEKCEEVCPMNVEIVSLINRVRALRNRYEVPGPLATGVEMCLGKGNNLGIPREDFVSLCSQLAEEMVGEGCKGFTSPIDVEGANLLVTVNSKVPFAEPEQMKWWWKIFHAAGESWTISSENWEGVNWAHFMGDDESSRAIVGRMVENMHRLKCKTLVLPE